MSRSVTPSPSGASSHCGSWRWQAAGFRPARARPCDGRACLLSCAPTRNTDHGARSGLGRSGSPVCRTISRGGADRLPLCRRLQAVFAREHGPYRSRGWPLRHRTAAQPLGGQTVPQVDPNQHARLDLVWDRPHPRYADGPRDRWLVFPAPLPSAEGWTVVWVWSTLLTLRQEARRQRNVAAASDELADLRERLVGPRTRLRRAADIDFQVKTILEKHHVARYMKVERTVREDHIYKQARRGRPGPSTIYRKITKRRFDIEWMIDQHAIAYDHKSDGMYP